VGATTTSQSERLAKKERRKHMKTNTSTICPKYRAELRFADGSSADCHTNNLRNLRRRIRRGFAGERTDWGHTAESPLREWGIYERGDGWELIEESANFRA